MIRLSLRATLFAALLGILVPAVVSAQSPARSGEGMGPLAMASLREATRLALHEGDTNSRMATDASRPGWVARRPVLFSALVGTAAGAVWFGVFSGPYCNPAEAGCQGSTRTEGIGLGAAVGAGVGALTGVIIDGVRNRR